MHWIRTIVEAVVIMLAIDVLVAAAASPDTRYFAGAALKQQPATPSEEITREQADSREAAGQAYYIATYDGDGQLVALEKRLHGDTFFRYTYEYPDGDSAVRTDQSGRP